MNDLQSNMEDKMFEIITDLLREDIDKTESIDKLLYLHNENRCTCRKPIKCDNCNEMVVMVSQGEFCPSCYC